MRELIEEYQNVTGGEPIAMYQIMGNEIFEKHFDNNPVKLYEYCIENRIRYEKVLKVTFEDDKDVLY